jgi:hypothetical protein
LATTLADQGTPGEALLAQALDTTAAVPPGPQRSAAAQQTLALAEVLVGAGAIPNGQYQDIAAALAPAGATVPTAGPGPGPAAPNPPGPGHHGHGDGPGSQD